MKLSIIIFQSNSLSCSTAIEMRDRALVAFTILTGARDSAVASAKIKHIDIADQSFYQDARK
jgi:integrase/recombinase XerD